MDSNVYINKAKELVLSYFNSEVDPTDNFSIGLEQVFVVWFCKTLSNWKALVSTTVSDGMYYEVTYNGLKQETYIDVYKKMGQQMFLITINKLYF